MLLILCSYFTVMFNVLLALSSYTMMLLILCCLYTDQLSLAIGMVQILWIHSKSCVSVFTAAKCHLCFKNLVNLLLT